MWSWSVLSICIGSIAAQALTEFDCSLYPALNRTFSVSAVKGTPPTVTNFTFYFNPCEPVGVPMCEPDDHLCGTEYVDFGDQWVPSAVKPYGSVSQGAEVIVQEAFETFYIYFSQAVWSGSQLFASVKVQCAEETELLLENKSYGSIDSKLLTLDTPAICGFSPRIVQPAELRYQWPVTDAIVIIAVVTAIAFLGAIVFLWLFLRLDRHGEDTLSPEYGLGDVLYIVVSGLAHYLPSFRRSPPKKN